MSQPDPRDTHTAAAPARRQKAARATERCPVCRWPVDRGHAENCDEIG
ncbi:Uncharacterised protein [Mycolicibacterium fortuitum]|uniref:Uncharacterized protein n=1 Tax=Mycolicibacterium fortuitum TaxID=1766 RepID=A0A378UZI3_MYCFO|nr:Uncharacterised protein [Mycolicibacterium fortuitum]